MVKQIQGKYKVNSPDLRPLWQEAKNRIAQLEAFEISHALRHKNKDADRLANQAMDRGMKRPNVPGQPAPTPLKATPYPTKSETPPDPYPKADTMLRGFTKDGVVHILGNATLPDGVFVKIIRE
jgi:probable phosphoglycerate mutase